MMKDIDGEIEAVSLRMGPEGETWLKDYNSAKAAYDEMDQLSKSGLLKFFNKPASQKYWGKALAEQQIAKTLAKFGTSLDGSYDELIKAMPLKVQPRMEALVVDELVNKFTQGQKEGFQAIQFPQLAEELNRHNFLWPEAKELRKVINDFAEIYQNDVILSALGSGISEQAFTSYLTTNPIVRVQYDLASKVFHKFKTLTGSAKGDASALVKATTKLLEDPLNPKNVQHALEAVQDDAYLTGAIKRLSKQAAADKHAGRGATAHIKTYKDGSGRSWLDDDIGRKVGDSIPMHRITNEEVANTIIKDSPLTALSKRDRARLIGNGFVAVGLNDGTVIKLY